MPCALRVGLTGGIGSGKSEAARYFASLGVPVIDTDTIARELVEPGQPALREIVALFGERILDPSGNLDRAKLRSLVFSDAGKRRTLERILHPRIRERTESLLADCDGAYCVVVVPLLIESGRDYPIDRILVIDTPVELQYQRVAQRDGASDREIEAVLHAQASRAERLQAADDVVVNDGSMDELQARLDALHRRYMGVGDK